MSASARIVAILLMVSASTAVPTGETRRTLANGMFIHIEHRKRSVNYNIVI